MRRHRDWGHVGPAEEQAHRRFRGRRADLRYRHEGSRRGLGRAQALFRSERENVDLAEPAPSLARGRSTMDWKIEVVTIPVSDIDRARDFYAEKVGFVVDIDHTISDEIRLVQLTPPGSACSIHLGKGTVDMEPGSIDGVLLVVRNVQIGRASCRER